MPAPHDSDQEATDHGNLMDLEVVEVEKESAGTGESQDEPEDESEEATQPKGASAEQVSELIAEEQAEAQDSVT